MSKKDIFSAIFEADLDEVRKRIKPTVFKKKGQLNKTNGDTPLHFSLYHPIRESVVRLLIQAEADVNAKNNVKKKTINKNRGRNIFNLKIILLQSTSLHFACLHKASVEIVKLLLSKGADVSLKDGNTPLHLAVSYYPIFTKNTINFDPAKLKLTTTPITKEFYTFPSIDLIQSLLDSGAEIDAKNNRTPLHFACLQKMNYSFIEFLLKSKANPNIPDLSTPFHSAIQMANQDIIDLFLQFGADPNLKDDNTPLHLACSGELSKETIEKVLKLTKDINSKNQEAPIHILCKNSSATPEIVSLFATYKADFNAKNKETPLHIAAKLQSTKSKIFEVLIENGAKVDEKNEQTPLHVACLCSATTKEALKIIIDQKKDMINAKDKSTPLHFACKFKLPLELIKILLEYGADINSKNDVKRMKTTKTKQSKIKTIKHKTK
ncbi:cyclin-dependent kinase inhibitor 2c [Anaeramoeba ignava]|uniref:Cyclin-dependent kinase inhibitor 2c n=1 Tax=Anaeramoeba ignava TaxID=1746090 RepID=A0A9Q0LGJ4_ANAIG|nr:cyclin-dependent kinase inhibitor 2c [Anaeramoeba ignava]